MSVKSFSFTPEYTKELEHFMAQPNRSRYLCELIRKDRLGIGGEVTMERVEQLIDEKLRGVKITSISTGARVDNEVMRDNLRDIFGL